MVLTGKRKELFELILASRKRELAGLPGGSGGVFDLSDGGSLARDIAALPDAMVGELLRKYAAPVGRVW